MSREHNQRDKSGCIGVWNPMCLHIQLRISKYYSYLIIQLFIRCLSGISLWGPSLGTNWTTTAMDGIIMLMRESKILEKQKYFMAGKSR